MNYFIMSKAEYFDKCSDECIFNKNVKEVGTTFRTIHGSYPQDLQSKKPN